MKLYLAGAELTHHVEKGLESGCRHMLGTFFILKDHPTYIRDNFELYGKLHDFFLDSGAFSAFTHDQSIDLVGYATYIKAHSKWITLYANLDVIGDWKGTLENQQRLEDFGLKPLPVFHANGAAPLELLRDMCGRYDYLALGGVAGRMGPGERARLLDRCWSVITDTWTSDRRVKVHGFGVTAVDMLERYPWYSVDSSSWLMGERTGDILAWDGMKMLSGTYKEKDSLKSLQRWMLPFAEGDKTYRQRSINNGEQFLKVEKFFTDVWAKRGVIWESA